MLWNTTDWCVMQYHYIDKLCNTTDWHIMQLHWLTCYTAPLIDMLRSTTDEHVLQHHWLTCYAILLIYRLFNATDWHVTQHYWLTCYTTPVIDMLRNTTDCQAMRHYWLTGYTTHTDWHVMQHHRIDVLCNTTDPSSGTVCPALGCCVVCSGIGFWLRINLCTCHLGWTCRLGGESVDHVDCSRTHPRQTPRKWNSSYSHSSQYVSLMHTLPIFSDFLRHFCQEEAILIALATTKGFPQYVLL